MSALALAGHKIANGTQGSPWMVVCKFRLRGLVQRPVGITSIVKIIVDSTRPGASTWKVVRDGACMLFRGRTSRRRSGIASM